MVENGSVALPNTNDLDKHVYCTECTHFYADEDGMHCMFRDSCYFWEPEDSTPMHMRPYYTPKEGKE